MNWPLMRNNITRDDVGALVNFLGHFEDNFTKFVPRASRFTNGPQVQGFEEDFAQWLGSKHALMVNSGASANLLTIAALAHKFGPGEVLVPAITWVSDIAAVLHANLKPVFVDVDPRTLGMSLADAQQKITARTIGVFSTHCLGFDCGIDPKGVSLIEDCCESLGATRNGKKLGTFGLASNFSFYYAHHMSTIEGGMICTDDDELYQCLRMMRSHGLVREMTDEAKKAEAAAAFPDLDPQFIFGMPAWNVRPTELNAVLGRSQLPRLDAMNAKRTQNLRTFLGLLDRGKYRTDYAIEGSSNYALPLVLVEPDTVLMARVLSVMHDQGVEYRRGTAGGGNQLRQPYARDLWGDNFQAFPQAEHIHFNGLYVGNYPDLEEGQIGQLCEALNAL